MTVQRPADYQPGAEASVSVKAVYELPDGSGVYTAADTLACTRRVRTDHGHTYARAGD